MLVYSLLNIWVGPATSAAIFGVLLVVPGRALASVSPDGERSVNFLCYNGLILYTGFVTKVKDLVILLDDRVYSDHHVFVILLAII